MTPHMTSKLSVNMAYFCKNVVTIMQLSSVRQGQCFPMYFVRSFQRSFENTHHFLLLWTSSEDAKKFRKCASFRKKRNLPKKFEECGPRSRTVC